jgi:magnesium chelatase family protein
VNLDQQSRIAETSSDIRSRVEKAQERQFSRYQEQTYNAKVPFEILTATSPLTGNQRKMIAQVSSKQHWSNRVQIKIIRLARTISDLADDSNITDESIWKAIQLKRTLHHKEQRIAKKN